MARGLNKLSARAVATLAKPGRHWDGGGLYLNISKGSETTRRRWVFLFRWEGKLKEMGLGGLAVCLSSAPAHWPRPAGWTSRPSEIRSMRVGRHKRLRSKPPLPSGPRPRKRRRSGNRVRVPDRQPPAVVERQDGLSVAPKP